jgi:hypothetical protein
MKKIFQWYQLLSDLNLLIDTPEEVTETKAEEI